MTTSSRQNSFAQLSNTQHFTRLYFQTCRIPTRHEKYTNFPRETAPAGKRGIHTSRHEKDVNLPREPVPAEESMDTDTFTLGNIILNRYPVLSTLTHQATEPGRVQQNFQQLKMESSNMEALPCFNSNAEATPQMETSRKGPRADSIQNEKGTTVTSS